MTHTTVLADDAAPTGATAAPASQTLAELQLWSALFMRGELRDGATPMAEDERYAVQLAAIRAAGHGQAPSSGDLHATDRRLWVLAAEQQPVREWRFAELAQVSALANWGGLVLVHPGGETDLVVTASPQPPSWREAAGWLKVEGAFAAGRGQLDDWLAQLPRRLAVA